MNNNMVNGNNKVEANQQQIDQLNGNSTKQRRTRVPDRPDQSLSLWSILKSFIGKDLTKIPLPVNFNEPLSMLQRWVICRDLKLLRETHMITTNVSGSMYLLRWVFFCCSLNMRNKCDHSLSHFSVSLNVSHNTAQILTFWFICFDSQF